MCSRQRDNNTFKFRYDDDESNHRHHQYAI